MKFAILSIVLGLLSTYVNGCQQPCQNETSGTCCIRGGCGCVEMLGSTGGCSAYPGPGSCDICPGDEGENCKMYVPW